MSILIFILILGLLVFVHELGHFAIAKLFKIRVDEFGLGFPPRAVRLFKRGETEYTLNWIPFGGFVKIYGENALEDTTHDPDRDRSFPAKPWWQQLLVLVAGVVMNMLLAWILFIAIFFIGAPTPASSVTDPSLLRNPQLTILEVAPQSPAFQSGLVAGDRIIGLTVNETTLTTFETREDFTDTLQSFTDEPVTITIERGNNIETVSVIPERLSDQRVIVGVNLDIVGMYRTSFVNALQDGTRSLGRITQETIFAFGNLIGDAFRGKADFQNLTGPVGLVGVVGDARAIGFVYVLMLTAIISINLAVLNLIPFPALDGGRIVMVCIEAITRKKIPSIAVQWINGIGFLLLIILMIAVTIKDIWVLF